MIICIVAGYGLCFVSWMDVGVFGNDIQKMARQEG
jgi:hypothetical protein